MTLTHSDNASTRSRLQFRRVVLVYDVDAHAVDFTIDGDTLLQVCPAAAAPGYIQNCIRAIVPPEVQEAVRRDFAAVRRFAEMAEATQPGAPIEHPHFQWMRRHIRFLYGVIAGLAALVVWLGGNSLPHQ